MLSIILGIIITAAAFYISILYKGTSLIVLGYAGMVLLIMACVFLAYRLYTIQCRVAFPIAIAECGKPLTVRIILENKGFLPCLKFRCLIEQKNRFLIKKQKKWLQGGLAEPGENSFDYSLVIEDYGSYELKLKKIRIYDLTGLFYFQKKVKSGGFVQVLPTMQEIGVHMTEATKNFFSDADVYDDFRPGYDRSELFQIRPFYNGDKIQSIHWKLSAKLDELLVKENSLPKACPVVFLLDYKNEKQKKAEKVNAYLVILASISFSLMDAGCPHFAAWYSGKREDIVRARVDDEESLYLFLSCYLEETFQKRDKDLADAYQEKYRGENYLFMLQLDENLQLLKNRDGIVKFELEDWEKRLSELDIIL